MIRKLIHIDEDRCNGCGICASACHEGAIGIVDGKAKLLRDDYCDGMGDCLPTCPTGAISFEEREAAAYDEAAVQENKKKKELQEKMKHMHEGGCPGSRVRMMQPAEEAEAPAAAHTSAVSQLRHWPVQIKLAPVNAPYFDGAKLLIAAASSSVAMQPVPVTRDMRGLPFVTKQSASREATISSRPDATRIIGNESVRR